MRCGKWEKWISDALDGALSGRRTVRLERHILGCASCRACREDLARLDDGAKGLADPGLTAGEWSDFGRRLESRLAAVSSQRSREKAPYVFRWKRAWAGAGFLVLAAAGAYLALFRPGGRGEQAFPAFEDPVARVLGEIGPNADLENSFNREIVTSINEAAGVLSERDATRPADEGAPVSFGDNPMFWEGLSEEELGYIESELRKEHGHGGLT
jgi:hypothetical protein